MDRSVLAKAHALYYDDLASFGWLAIARGIILAGGAYPLAIAAGYLCMGAIALLLHPSSLRDFDPSAPFLIVFGMAAFALSGIFVGLIWSSVVAAVTLPVMHFVVWSLKIRPDWVNLGAFSGGLVAFLGVLPLTIQIPMMFQIRPGAGPLIALLLGPCLATIIGQIGGARGGSGAAWRLRAKNASRRALIELGWRAPITGDVSDDALPFDSLRPRFRFRTIHLLWVGMWLSLLLTVIRLSGIPYELILPVIVCWLAYQTVTLAVGQLLVRRLGPWWRARRQIRST